MKVGWVHTDWLKSTALPLQSWNKTIKIQSLPEELILINKLKAKYIEVTF